MWLKLQILSFYYYFIFMLFGFTM
uniref:Uncharacterized protein n=1 Tax=Anguilla anguilla TaxID=7936 RepID=A0A0E9TLN7_ANGAN